MSREPVVYVRNIQKYYTVTGSSRPRQKRRRVLTLAKGGFVLDLSG